MKLQTMINSCAIREEARSTLHKGFLTTVPSEVMNRNVPYCNDLL